MLLSKDAIADVIESVRGTDFYRPAHETIFDAIVDLYGRGEPVDPITDGGRAASGAASWSGSAARRTCTPCRPSVPIAANAGYYAEIVREKAILRRLVDAGTRIAQMGYAGEGQVDDVVDRAQAEVYGVTDKRTSEDYAPLSDIMEARPRRDRGDLQPRRRDDRRPDRLRRPRRADQRPARAARWSSSPPDPRSGSPRWASTSAGPPRSTTT